MKKIMIMVGAITLISLGIMGCSSTESISMSKYLNEISFIGIDGCGTVDIDENADVLDEKQLVNDLKDIVVQPKDLDENEKMNLALDSDGVAVMAVKRAIKSIDITPNENLSNGQEIEISINIDNDEAERYGLDFIDTNVKILVKGLKKAVEVDVFDHVSLDCSNEENAQIKIMAMENTIEGAYNSITLDSSYFEIEGAYQGLKDGDIVKVVLSEVGKESIQEAGIKPKESTKEFVFEGYTKPVNKINDISEEQLDLIISEVTSSLEHRNPYNDVQYTKCQYLGMYLLTGTKKVSFSLRTQKFTDAIVIMKTTLTSKANKFTPKEYYIGILIEDFAVTKSKYVDFTYHYDGLLVGEHIKMSDSSDDKGYEKLSELKTYIEKDMKNEYFNSALTFNREKTNELK